MAGEYTPAIKQWEKTMNGTVIYQWYLDNAKELFHYFGKILIDDSVLSWLLIENFPLPHTFHQKDSVLLVTTPGINIENHAGYDFFMTLNLSRLDGKQETHLIDREGYNPYKSQGYCRLSYHLKAFNPSYPIEHGDRLLDACQSLFHFLARGW